MTLTEIPLTPDNQQFAISLNSVNYNMQIIWRGTHWCLDLRNESGVDIIAGIPLITGADLLEQYAWLKLGFGLRILTDNASDNAPGEYDLGYSSHLCLVTESL